MITDVQVHVWVPDSGAPQPGPAHRPHGFPVEQLIAEMDAIGVDRAVLTPPSLWTRFATEYAVEAAAKYPGRFAIMDQFNPEAPGARERLRTQITEKPFVGIRVLYQTHPQWLEDGSIDCLLADCERLGLPVCAWVGGKSPQLLPIAQRYPGLKLLVDHMDTVRGATAAERFASIDDLVGLARFPTSA
jgi:L-fuconolactonase